MEPSQREVLGPRSYSDRLCAAGRGAGAGATLAEAAGRRGAGRSNRDTAETLRRALDRDDGGRTVRARQLGLTREGLYDYMA
jgi:hypothetical protein